MPDPTLVGDRPEHHSSVDTPRLRHTVPFALLDRYRDAIRRLGPDAERHQETQISASGPHRVFYVPFEHVNVRARIVIVGITPGPNQIALSYASVRKLLAAGLPDDVVLAEAKREAAFGGPAMRPNLVRMLDAFGFASILDIADVEMLWGDAADLLHATSVVPHAAFVADKPFAGSFEDIMASTALRATFEDHFVPTLALLPPDAHFVALGRTPLAALDWCAARGYLRPDQVLGAFAHPSAAGGSQVGVYLGNVDPEELSEGNPVRSRVAWLREAAARMDVSTRALGGGTDTPLPIPLVGAPLPVQATVRRPQSSAKTERDLVVPASTDWQRAFEEAGYQMTGQTEKVALFERSSAQWPIYLVKRPGKFKVIVHPTQSVAADAAADRVKATFEGAYHNSNMRKFPSRMNGGKTPIRYGLGYIFPTTESLRRFLNELAE